VIAPDQSSIENSGATSNADAQSGVGAAPKCEWKNCQFENRYAEALAKHDEIVSLWHYNDACTASPAACFFASLAAPPTIIVPYKQGFR